MRTQEVVVNYVIEPEPTPEQSELESVNELGDFQFVYALAHRALEYEAASCETDAARQQVAHLLDRLVSIEWLVAE